MDTIIDFLIDARSSAKRLPCLATDHTSCNMMMYPAVNMCFRPASWFFIVSVLTMASNIYCNSPLNFFLEKLIQLIWRWYVLLHLHFLIHILAYQRCTLSLLCFCIFCFLPPFTLTTKFPLYTIHAWFSIATNHCSPYPQRSRKVLIWLEGAE